jgi:hypothetical protein
VSARDDYERAIAQLALMVDVWRTIQAEHVRTDTGHCAHRTCGRPGYGSAYLVWPCAVRAAADAAAALHRQRPRKGPPAR